MGNTTCINGIIVQRIGDGNENESVTRAPLIRSITANTTENATHGTDSDYIAQFGTVREKLGLQRE